MEKSLKEDALSLERDMIQAKATLNFTFHSLKEGMRVILFSRIK